MVEVRVPYDRTELTGHIRDEEFAGEYHAALPPAAADEGKEVDRALDCPIGSPRLEELAAHARNAVLIASDHTRPAPSEILAPRLLERLRRGNPHIDITILIATGFHRKTTREELIRKFGRAIVAAEKIVVHDSAAADRMVKIGVLPSGGELLVNKLAAETDLLLAEGVIEPHFFAGFSGGRKSVLPGIASRSTVLANHCAEFIMDEHARTGILEGNPIHRDMLYAAKTAKLRFILNVVIDGNKRIIAAFAGDMEKAHRAGTDFLSGYARVRAPEADIVITGNGGWPLDQNVYQTVKGMTAGEALTRPGGVIVVCAGCRDGHGGKSFCDHLSHWSPREILEQVKCLPRDRTEPDQWEYQILARILAQRTVIMVTVDCDHAMLQQMGLRTASTLDEALDAARALCGPKPRILAVPDGVSVIPEKLPNHTP